MINILHKPECRLFHPHFALDYKNRQKCTINDTRHGEHELIFVICLICFFPSFSHFRPRRLMRNEIISLNEVDRNLLIYSFTFIENRQSYLIAFQMKRMYITAATSIFVIEFRKEQKFFKLQKCEIHHIICESQWFQIIQILFSPFLRLSRLIGKYPVMIRNEWMNQHRKSYRHVVVSNFAWLPQSLSLSLLLPNLHWIIHELVIIDPCFLIHYSNFRLRKLSGFSLDRFAGVACAHRRCQCLFMMWLIGNENDLSGAL